MDLKTKAASRWRQFLQRSKVDLERNMSANAPIPLRLRFALGTYLFNKVLWKSDLTTRAAGIAYTFVFSLVPLLTTTLAFFTAIPGLQNERDRIQGFLYTHLLPGAVQNVKSYIEQFSERAAAAGLVSSVVFIVLTLMLFNSVESSFNLIWEVERPRSWGERVKTLALFFTTGAVGAALLVVIGKEASRFSTISLSSRLGEILVAWLIFTVANRVLPNTKVNWRSAFVGGFIAGTIWHFLKNSFTWYINSIGSYENIYGALGAVPAFFLWLYLSFLLLLAGSYIAFVSQNLRALFLKHQSNVGGHALPFYSIAVLSILAGAFKKGGQPLDVKSIAKQLHIAEYFVEEALKALSASGLTVAIEEKKRCTYVLVKPSHLLNLQDVISNISNGGLLVPELNSEQPWYRKLKQAFQDATSKEANLLARLTIADFEDHAPMLRSSSQTLTPAPDPSPLPTLASPPDAFQDGPGPSDHYSH